MSYIALARKWRPRTFSELLGQTHVTRALTQSLENNRVHHAYLFTGTRGVGKTSVARIMAKALNCEQGMSATPCLLCDACLAIEQGRFVDLIEIDAASKTRVEDTRELLDNVQYAPSLGRFKIYLIDEVHMLSQHSFNALLKTLEEPPAHVKFLLATTEAQKLPITILSRCLQFNLKSVSVSTITQHLQHILKEEQIPNELPALTLLAKAANGSMRDALSLLDQAIASRSQEQLISADVASLLGHSTEDFAQHILEALITNNPKQLITISHRIAEEGGQFIYVLDELLGYLHRIAIGHALAHAHAHALTEEAEPNIEHFQQCLSAEDTQLFYQITLKGLNELQFAPTLAMGFEMTLLRLYTFRPANISESPPLTYQIQSPLAVPSPITEANAEVVPIQAPVISAPAVPSSSWSEIIASLKLTGLALSAISHTELLEKTQGHITLKVEKAHQSLLTAFVIEKITAELSRFYSEPLRLSFEYHDILNDSPALQKKASDAKIQEECSTALLADPVFQTIQKEFSADLVKNSISAVKNNL